MIHWCAIVNLSPNSHIRRAIWKCLELFLEQPKGHLLLILIINRLTIFFRNIFIRESVSFKIISIFASCNWINLLEWDIIFLGWGHITSSGLHCKRHVEYALKPLLKSAAVNS